MYRVLWATTFLILAPSLAHAQKDVKISFRPELEDKKSGDVEYCVVHLSCSEKWRKSHKMRALVGKTTVQMPVVFRSDSSKLYGNDVGAKQDAVVINDVPIKVLVEPEEVLEVTGVSFEIFEDQPQKGKRALVTRFTLRPISEIKNYQPPEPNKLRIGASSFNKYELAKSFPGLKQILESAKQMPRREIKEPAVVQ